MDIDLELESIKPVFKKLKIGIISILTIVILLFLLACSLYKVQTGMNTVIVRFGEVKEIVDTPGIHFKLPLIDKIQMVDVESIY